MNEINTCQICGRNIKAKNGRIAHHGYTRPDLGWQTKSCFGARRLPLEESCDAIEDGIKMIERYIKNATERIQFMISNA